MKKNFYSIMIVFLFAGTFVGNLSAQTNLADFDTGNGFLDSQWNYVLNNGGEIVDNPLKDGLNSTNKVYLDHRPATAQWTDVNFLYHKNCENGGPDAPISIGSDNRYLHVMVYSATAADGFIAVKNVATNSYSANSSSANELRFSFTAGKWVDIVKDLNGLNNFYGLYLLSQDWTVGTAERYFYYDEIILSDNANPRVSTSTGIPANTASKARVYASNGKLIIENRKPGESVQIFDIAGRKLYEETQLNSGIYLVKVGKETTKIVVK